MIGTPLLGRGWRSLSSGSTFRREKPRRIASRLALAPGTRLGPYDIGALLGTGGMGEVYRARDTKLGRDVAVKVLLPEVARDPDRLARFGREAQLLASLNHTNIAYIHGLEETGGITALVMELVEGPTLADRIVRGHMSPEQASGTLVSDARLEIEKRSRIRMRARWVLPGQRTLLRARSGANNTGAGMLAISSAGTLAVVRGAVAGGEDNQLTWLTHDGQASSAEPASGGPSGARVLPRISPDRSRAMVTIIRATRWEVWFADWARNVWTACADYTGPMARLQHAWAPDGRRILLMSNDSDGLLVHAIDGAAPDQVLVREPNRTVVPAEWLADGRIVYLSTAGGSAAEVRLLEAGASAGHLIATGTAPAVSPDRRWLAYVSTQTGQANIVVQAFPGPGPRTQVSAGGGIDPAWSPDGRAIYYHRPDGSGGAVWSVDIVETTALSAGSPREL